MESAIPRHLYQDCVGAARDENGIAGDGGNWATLAPGIFQERNRILDSWIGPTRAEGGEFGRGNQVGEVAGMVGAIRHDRQHGGEQEGQDADYHGRMLATVTMSGKRSEFRSRRSIRSA